MNNRQIGLTLTAILKRLDVIDAKLSGVPSVQVQLKSRLLSTYVVLRKFDAASACEVAAVAGCSRAFASKNLNDLAAMGLAVKRREGRIQKFTLKTIRANEITGGLYSDRISTVDGNGKILS